LLSPSQLLKDVKSSWLSNYTISDIGENYEVLGDISFCTPYKGDIIEDTYSVKLLISKKFPNKIPKVFEVGGRIEPDPDNHINVYDSNSLCLEIPPLLNSLFNKDPSLTGFLNNLVIPFLFNYSYKEKNVDYPKAQWCHGGAGVLDFYMEYFGINKRSQAKEFFRIGFHQNKRKDGSRSCCSGLTFKGHSICYCGSGKKIRDCHRNVLKKYHELLSNGYSLKAIKRDLGSVKS